MSKYLIMVLLLLSTTLFGQRTNQQRKTDSLHHLLLTAKEDTGKAMILLTLGAWYETNDQDSAKYFLEAGRALSEKLNYNRGRYFYCQQATVLLYTKGEYDNAMVLANKGLQLARQMGDSAKAVTMLNNIGIICSYLGDFKSQLDYALMVVNATVILKDSSMLSGSYHNLANCYFNLGQYRKQADAALYALRIDSASKIKNGYINRVQSTLAQGYEGLRMKDSALYYYQTSIKESQRLNDVYAEGIIYGYECNLLAGMGRFNEMLQDATQSLTLAKKLQSRQMLSVALYYTSYAQLLNGKLNEAKQNITQALDIAKQDSLKDELKNGYTVLSYIAAATGDYSTSVFAKGKADSITDASLNETVLKGTADLEKKYQTEKKDNQIKLQQAQLQRKSILNYLLIGGALSVLAISLLGFRNFRQKQKLQQQRINELETEKQLAATESVLKGEEQERTRLAKDLHDGLGGMLSGIKYSLNTMKGNLVMTPENAQAFERSMDMLDSSIKEMRRVAHNMMPEALVKFGLDTALKDFCSDINQSGALKLSYQSIGIENAETDQTTAITIYRIVQELINNTLKHAAAKNAIVQLSRSGSQLSVTVEDDGKGFDTVILQKSKGIGWTNIQSRIEFLKGTMDVQSAEGKGTSVHIELNA